MNLSKADEILSLVSSALQRESKYNIHRNSELKGFSISEIDTAFKIIIARNYLMSIDTLDGFAVVKKQADICSANLWNIITFFRDDKKVDEFEGLSEREDGAR